LLAGVAGAAPQFLNVGGNFMSGVSKNLATQPNNAVQIFAFDAKGSTAFTYKGFAPAALRPAALLLCPVSTRGVYRKGGRVCVGP